MNVKDKGSNFERLVVSLLNEGVNRGVFKRIVGSGAIGTSAHEPELTGDVKGEVYGLPNKFKIECKDGYGGAKQFTLKKLWLDKITEEARATFSIPVLIGKFSGARAGSTNTNIFAVLSLEEFIDLLNHVTFLQEELEKKDEIRDSL